MTEPPTFDELFSRSYPALAPELRRAFRLLGLHAGPEIGFGAAAALIGVGVATAKRQLRALTDVHLLQETSADRFQLHALLRSYARERALAEETQEERTQAVRRLLSWYLLTADKARSAILPFSPSVPLVPAGQIELTYEFENGPQAMNWFEAERPNLLAALRQTAELGQFDIGWKLAIVTTGFFELRSYWEEWEENHRSGLAAATALGDPLGEAANLLMLGDVAWRVRHFDEAIARYRRAAEIGRDISMGWIEGFAIRGQGLIQEDQGDFNAASELFESALQVFRSNGLRRGEGMSLLSLGKCAHALNDPVGAATFGTEAVRIFEEINDTWTSAWGRLALATSLMGTGADLDAMELLRQAAKVFQELEDHRSEAQALVALGELFLRSDDVADARVCWSRALELYEALDDPQSAEIRTRLEGLDTDR